jgi:protein phosphatase
MNFRTNAFGITHTGLARDNNEDTFTSIDHKHFFAVADGMGGHLAGEVAATQAVTLLSEAAHAVSPSSLEHAGQWLREALTQTNKAIFDYALSRPHCHGMGTTICCFTLSHGHLTYGHVGDSRLYRYREELSLLTHDHSIKAHPNLTPDHPLYKHRHAITRAMGLHPQILPDIGQLPVQQGDLYLLCSDGLSDYVPLSVMNEILATSLSLDDKGKKLLDAALESGGRDNITALLVEVV